MDVPKILAEYLRVGGYTQTVAARQVGTTQGTFSKWLAGTQSPNKRQWDRVVRAIEKDPKSVGILPEIMAPGVQQIPLISWVSAGGLIDANSQVPEVDSPKMIFSGLGDGEFFALEVKGDSMDRFSPDGSVIVVDRRERDLNEGKPYIFWHRVEGTTFKLWQSDPDRLVPHSWNAANKPIFIKRKRDFAVIGRVRRTVLDL